MQALPDRVTVLVDEALRFEDIDVAKTREELASALERQKAKAGDSRAIRARASRHRFCERKTAVDRATLSFSAPC